MVGESLVNGARKVADRCGRLLQEGRWWLRGRPLPRFRRALRRHFEGARGHPMYDVWWTYASTSLDRGRAAVQAIGRHTPVAGKRCLDIGCAYGGFPVACAEAGAESALGIELNEQLLALARELLQDVPCGAEVRHGDAMDREFLRSLGTFDLITCNDVIEHVDDPWRLMEHFGQLLRPGGHLFLEIPNYQCQQAVVKDGHYGLFGITLLPRPEAKHYYQQTNTDDYTVGEYLPLGEYRRALAQQGIDSRCLNPLDFPDGVFDRLHQGMTTLRRDYAERVRQLKVDDATKQGLREALAHYLDEFDRSYREFRAAAEPAERQRRREELLLTYVIDFWRLVGVKRADARGGNAPAVAGGASKGEV